MGTLAQHDLQQYANVINGLQSYPPAVHMRVLYSVKYKGKVYSKGRPRFSGAGHTYTPTNTRKFEQILTDLYTDTRDCIIMCPVHIKVTIYDKVPKAFSKTERKLAMNRFIFSATGDLADNKVKSVIDAGNGVLYADDSQIAAVNYTRMYSSFEGFTLELRRVGLSPAEVNNLGNLL